MPDSYECETPPVIAPSISSKYMLNRDEYEEREIRDYLQTQLPDENPQHLEKLHSETVLGRRVDVWDVHTDVDRWWVLTEPTNLYQQKHFPSMDYLISFHVGLTARIYECSEKEPTEPWRLRAAAAWRRFAQADEAFDAATEAEDFQAVGMRCRECLLEFIRAVLTTQSSRLVNKRLSWLTLSGGANVLPMPSPKGLALNTYAAT